VGFREPTVVYDDEAPYQANALIIAAPRLVEDNNPSKAISLLCSDSCKFPLVDEIESKLREAGCAVERSTVKELPKPGQDIVSILKLHEPFLEKISETSFRELVHYVRKEMKLSISDWIVATVSVKG
jgi:hypothetical protein